MNLSFVQLCISALNFSLWACGQSEYFADFQADINTRNVTLAETVVILLFHVSYFLQKDATRGI
jgi:uncharacterized lipoprotein YehR (DUF1307 family)